MSEEPKIIKTQEELITAIKAIHTNGNQFKFTNHHFECDVVLDSMINFGIHQCTFRKRFTLCGGIESDVIFKDVIFDGVADFTNYTFSKNVRFHGCTFNDVVRFNNTKFIGLADFYYSTFNERTIFFKTDFLDRTVFSATTFNENVLFTYSLIKDHLLLRGATFKKGLDLSLTILSGTVNLFGLKIPDYESVSDIIDEVDYDKAVCVDGIIPHKNKRETFRILKKELLDQGNAIDALYMASKEKSAYSKQLKSDRKHKIGKWYRRGQNRLILYLGRISNSHGESWTKGVGFTLGIGLVFFYLSIINTEKYFFTLNPYDFNWEAIAEGLDYYFEFLLPTHNSNYLDILGPEFLFKLWDFLGRIFVSFGIYQTIVAFRKYHIK